MSHDYDARAISTSNKLVTKTGTPAKRDQLIIKILKEAHEFTQTTMVVEP